MRHLLFNRKAFRTLVSRAESTITNTDGAVVATEPLPVNLSAISNMATVTNPSDPGAQTTAVPQVVTSETVILVAPSGTVGGSVIITSVPVTLSGVDGLTFSPPGPALPSLSYDLGTSTISATTTSLTSSSSLSTTSRSTSSSTKHSTSTSTSTSAVASHTSTSSASSSSSSSSHHLSRGAIGGIAAGVAITFLALLIALLIFLCRRRYRRLYPKSPKTYPEEAWLYDPHMSSATAPRGPFTLGPVPRLELGEGVVSSQDHESSGGAATTEMGPATREGTSGGESERVGLLRGRADSGAAMTGGDEADDPDAIAPVPASADFPFLPISRGRYAPAPTTDEDGDIADQQVRNPFRDEARSRSTEYDAGRVAMGGGGVRPASSRSPENASSALARRMEFESRHGSM